jgi:hypothetical protein
MKLKSFIGRDRASWAFHLETREMLKSIRKVLLQIKKGCEDCTSPVPRKIRADIHALGKWLFHLTYGMTPDQAHAYLSGTSADAVTIIHANRCLRDYSCTLLPTGGSHHHIHFSEDALLAMTAYYAMNKDWQQMLSVNGIHIESCLFEDQEIAERFDYPKGTKFYFIKPKDDDG